MLTYKACDLSHIASLSSTVAPSDTLVQEPCSPPFPTPLRLQLGKNPQHNVQSSSSTREAWEMESSQPRKYTWVIMARHHLAFHRHSHIPLVFVGKGTKAQGCQGWDPSFPDSSSTGAPSPHLFTATSFFPSLLNWNQLFLSQCNHLSHFWGLCHIDRMSLRNISLLTFLSSCLLDYFATWEAFHICSLNKQENLIRSYL